MRRSVVLLLTSLVVLAALPARAIPAFARKYGTSCTTCHTVYPKLTPFGEAFRRNGFRFPGVDSDYAKQETVTTKAAVPGSEPAWVSAIPPLAFGVNGQVFAHPDKNSSGGAADNHALLHIGQIVQEGHLWSAGTLNDSTSYFGEVTFSRDGTIDVEHAQLYFNDLIGPKHAVNLRIGRGFSNVSSYGPHSSFLADALMPQTGAAQLNGASSGWNLADHFNGLEVSGVVADGRVGYHVGLNAGSQANVQSAEDVYGHVGVKLGGMRLDGEGKSETNAERPWEETALTLDAFAYHAYGDAQFGSAAIKNTANTLGFGLRGQYGSLELNSGLIFENHKHLEPTGLTGGTLLSQYNELSYMVSSWLVPAIRFEFTKLSPDAACTTTDGSGATVPCSSVSDWRLLPGVAVIPYPNVKLVFTALIEGASGAPAGGWGQVGGFANPTSPTSSIGPELQNVQLYLAWAY